MPITPAKDGGKAYIAALLTNALTLHRTGTGASPEAIVREYEKVLAALEKK